MKKNLALLTGVCVLFIGGCYYDIEEELYRAQANCAVGTVTYSGTVVPILQGHGCVGCHSGGAPSGNLSLDTYSGVNAVVLNGKLYGSITHATGYSPMPQGGVKMTTCNINKLKAWIDAGAPNN